MYFQRLWLWLNYLFKIKFLREEGVALPGVGRLHCLFCNGCNVLLWLLILNILLWLLILNVNFRALFSLSILQRLQCSTLTIDSQCEYQSIIFTHLWCGSDNENYLKIKFWKCIASYRSSFRLSAVALICFQRQFFPLFRFFLHL